MAETIFSKILRNEIPCNRIYEDELVLAFLDINPVSKGHVLVIPREEAETLDKLSEQSAAALGKALPRIARAVMAVTGAQHFNILQNNGAPSHQAVMHVHFHVIPKYDDGTGLGIVWKAGTLEDGEALAAAIADAL